MKNTKMKAVECMVLVFLTSFLAITNALDDSSNEAPKILEGPVHIMVTEGSLVILKCRTSGTPKPKIEWEKDDTKLKGMRFETLPSGDLKIETAYFFDNGVFTCKAENEHGIAKESARLIIKQKTRVFVNSHLKEIGVGQTAILDCNVMFDDTLSVEIEWLKDNKSIAYDIENKYIKGNDNSLSILKTVGSDSGEYTCVARTDIDEGKATTTLVVEDVPNAPILKEINCNGLKAEISWMPQGDNRSPILFYSIEYNTSFTPEKWDVAVDKVRSSYTKHTYFMNPWGVYSFRVLAHNKLGQSHPSENSATCTTQPDVPYKNPTNVKAEGTDPTNMVISWTPMPEIEHNGPQLHYRVSWKKDTADSEWESKDIFDWKENKVIVNDQPMFQKYLVKVLAINQLGESKIPAKEVIGFSGEGRPLLAPSNFKMMKLTSSTEALLKWDPVSSESLQGHFKGYKLQTWTAEEGEESPREVLVDNNVNEVLFNQLKPYSKNFVRISAYNSLFDGPSTVISFDTPEGYPSNVENLESYVLSSSSILLTWDEPLNKNGRLTGYRIYYEAVRGPFAGLRIEGHHIRDPKLTSCILKNLRPGIKYRIYVTATTAMGEGQEYFIESTTLRRDRKSKEPSVPDFKWEPLTSIMVNWQPFNGQPTGTHFFTQYRIKGETEWQNTHEEDEQDFLIVGGLRRDSVYEFRVVSVDGKYQTASEIKEIKTL
ncbi:neuroglian-like isoform X2 [Episyrphus balteatus]|uniref:neuroglian-like isoform X2 n=1 Tax=Episyrphus balteatus TaxID=286459 RepID=UPI002485FFFD|nr:neuroglian-like isoform X2 [Episyrphus balteatus]